MFYPDSGYTHESSVGPVFDLTKWTGRGRLAMSVAVLVFGVGFLAAAAFVWEPSWFFRKAPAELKDAIDDIRQAWRNYPWAMRGGVATGAVLGVISMLGVSNLSTDAFRTDFFFRAGPGGLWLRMPYGLSWSHLGLVSRALELELPWDEIEKYKITQVRQLGSLSRNVGNVRADLELSTRSGPSYVIGLDGLEAPAYLVYERIDEARRTPNGNPSPWTTEDAMAV